MAENSNAKNDTFMLFDRCEIWKSKSQSQMGTTKEYKLVMIEKWRVVDDECLESSIYMFGFFGE